MIIQELQQLYMDVLTMKVVQKKSCDCIDDKDRMVNEGLSNSVIVQNYDESYLKLKQKEEAYIRKSEEQRGNSL